MAAFLTNWQNIADNVVDEMPDVTLASMLLERIKHSIELKSGIGQYYRYGSTHKDHTYEFLLGCIRRRATQAQKDRNRERQLQHVTDTLRAPAGAAGEQDDGYTPGKATKKAKKNKEKKEKKVNDAEEAAAGADAPGGKGR